MVIYWRIGSIVLVVFIVIQAIIFAINTLPINAVTFQQTTHTLLNAHLQQRLPEYYYKVSESTEVWASVSPTMSRDSNRTINILLPGTMVTVLDSVFSDDEPDDRWLKVAFEGEDQDSRTGWIQSSQP